MNSKFSILILFILSGSLVKLNSFSLGEINLCDKSFYRSVNIIKFKIHYRKAVPKSFER